MMQPAPAVPAESGPKRKRTKGLAIALMAGIFVLPAAFGFIFKFVKFVRTVGTDELGGAALVPMLNYLAVAGGFICLLVWAAMRGMFHDIEGPKYTMLQNEEELDRYERLTRSS